MATLQVNINDVNDNPPYFPQQQYKAEVEETAPKGELVTNIRAEDRDIDNNFQYIIVTGNDNQAFEITNTGDLVVFDSGRLDYETNKVSLTYLYWYELLLLFVQQVLIVSSTQHTQHLNKIMCHFEQVLVVRVNT